MNEDNDLAYFKRFGLKTSLWISILFKFITSMEFSVYILTLKHMQDELNFNNRLYAFLIALMALCSICYNPIMMHVCTLYPPYAIMAICVYLAILGDIILYFAGHYSMLAIALIPKGLIGPPTSCLGIIFDASVDPSNRIMWVNKLAIFDAFGGVLGVVISVFLPWRQVYLSVACVMAPMGIIFAFIDGPKCLPRKDVDSPLSQGAIQIWRRLICKRRVWAMLTVVTFAHVAFSTQVEFYGKFITTEYGWSEGKTVYLIGGFWLCATVLGKLVGAYVLDRKKNQMGLVDEKLTPNLREKLYTSIMRLGIPWFLMLQCAGTFGFHIHSGIAFLLVISIQGFCIAFFPETSIQLWSVSLDDVPYVYPIGSLIWSGSHALLAMVMGSVLDAGLSYPYAFMISTQIGWISVAMLCIESFTQWNAPRSSEETDDGLLLDDEPNAVNLDNFNTIPVGTNL